MTYKHILYNPHLKTLRQVLLEVDETWCFVHVKSGYEHKWDNFKEFNYFIIEPKKETK